MTTFKKIFCFVIGGVMLIFGFVYLWYGGMNNDRALGITLFVVGIINIFVNAVLLIIPPIKTHIKYRLDKNTGDPIIQNKDK